ncbi:MAG TPA: glycerol-3-phosphate acyltransferase, partial [Rhizobiales bacterium]|nr:glycerol-3-phosphate acyltransferase [Hyphomicrobiales bacterium]
MLAGVLALIGLLDRLLVPSVRWVLRRRLNRAIDQLNARLMLKIPPFKLARRKVLIDSLLFDPDVLKGIDDEAVRLGEPHDVVQARAKRYAREIVPAFSAYTYFGFAMKLAKAVSTFLYRVRLGAINEEALRSIPKDASVVFVINHRSNMDYVLVSHMVSTSSALSYAVGEWARVWLLQNFIRAMGGYFVRRDSSSNPLYRKVLARYVQMATAAGVAQAVFPEGGLSRDGALQAPKLGLLNYIVSGFDLKGARDIVFVPVGLNYDRVLEDRILLSAAERAGAPAGSGRKKSSRFAFRPAVFVR